MLEIKVITLFPDFFKHSVDYSVLHKALDRNIFNYEVIDLRDFGLGSRRAVDDTAYGGGAGMVIMPEPIFKAINEASSQFIDKDSICRILLSPSGKIYNQNTAKKLTGFNSLIIFCGHYEGFDARVKDLFDIEISLGSFVMTGGEVAALAIIDSVVRLLPGTLNTDSLVDESFKDKELEYIEYDQYTKPAVWRNKKVPEVLLSGNHRQIEEYRISSSALNSAKIK